MSAVRAQGRCAAARDALGNHQTLFGRLTRALDDELPLLTRDGGFIREGYAPELDELRRLRDESSASLKGTGQKPST